MKWGFGRRAAVVAAMLLAGCTTLQGEAPPPAASIVVEDVPMWRLIADPEDARRIEQLDAAWDEAVGEARARGFRRAVAAEGELLDPAASLPHPAPTPGPYTCRTVKVGSQGNGPPFVAYKPFFCYVDSDGELLTLVKQTGSQRPAGRLYPDTDNHRMVFLGTLALGAEEAPLPYGDDPDRDMAGIIERIAPFRFRLVLPWPRYESKLDVIELIPVQE